MLALCAGAPTGGQLHVGPPNAPKGDGCCADCAVAAWQRGRGKEPCDGRTYQQDIALRVWGHHHGERRHTCTHRNYAPGNPWEAVGSAAGALGNLAHGDPACREEVSRCQGIEDLVRVVRTAPGSVRDCAAMALANLVAGSQGRIAACGGIEALLDLLVPGRSVELNKPVHEILTVLAKSSPDYEAQIRAGGGMEKVIAQLTPPYEFTSTHPSYTLTLAALCSAGNTLLAVAGGSADTIMDHGDVAKLIALVQPDSPAPVRPVAICALGFLASASKAYQDSIRESKGIDRLVAVLGWGDAQELQLAARALAGMAADNEQNQNAIRHAHGIQALIGVLGNRPAASAAAAALAAIAAGNEENRLAWGNAMGSKRC